MRRVVVTGLGIVSCIGNDKDTVIKNLTELNSGISKAPEYEEFSFRSLIHGKPNVKLYGKALDLAESLSVPLHTASTAMQLFHAGKAQFPDGDNWVVTKVIEEIIGAELHR